MANWQNEIDLTREWENENIVEICKDVIKGLQNLKRVPEDMKKEVEELIEGFQCLIDSECDDFDDYNECHSKLYDLGDTRLDNKWPGKKLAWIKTF